MANPNIDLLGAVYPAVAGVTLPTQGGGTATFPYVEGSQTITQNGTVDVTNLAEVVVNVSGGGGASNIVTGTFKGTTAGAAMDITLPYTGSGYPVAFMVYPKDGLGGNPAFSALVQRYALFSVFGVKYNADTPTFTSSGDNNGVSAQARYKSSSTSATSYANSANGNVNVMSGASASDSATGAVKFKSATKMSVLIASTSYGFAANIEYTYHVIYSS